MIRRPRMHRPLSRRALVGAAATPLGLGAVQSGPEEAVDIAQRWLAKRAQARLWMGRWSRLETWLARRHGWYDLDEAQQRTLDAAQRLYAIDARLDGLEAEQAALLARLVSSPARSPNGVIAKLVVAKELLDPEGEPHTHRLVADAWRELLAVLGEERGRPAASTPLQAR